MPKFANSLVMDAAFDYIDQADTVRVLSAYTAGDSHATVVSNTLASTAIAEGEYVKAAGDVSGRKVTVGAKNGVAVGANGIATHIALTRTADSSVRYVTTCTSQSLTSGNTVNIPAWKIEITAP